MSSQLEILKRYFRDSGEAEQELDILQSIYVAQPTIQARLRDTKANFHLIIGLKGVGKSALLHSEYNAAQESGVGLLLKPSDMSPGLTAEDTALGDVIRKVQASLTTAIAVKLGERLNNKLATTTEQVLRLQAIREGAASADFIEKTARVLTHFTTAEKHFDFKQLMSDMAPLPTVNALHKAIATHAREKGTQITVCFDDTDFIASADPKDAVRIWGIIVAAKNLAATIPGSRFIIAIKSNVWHRLLADQSTTFQDTDKLLKHVIDLSATEELLSTIFQRRIERAANDCVSQGIKNPGNIPIDFFFSTREVTLPETDDERRQWSSLLSKNSRNRARDLVQLVHSLIEATQPKNERIVPGVAAEVVLKHSQRCITYLTAEFGRDIQPLDVVIEYLQDFPSDDVDFETLRKILEDFPTRTTITVRGVALKPRNKADFIKLLGAFFEAGVLNARIKDVSKSKGFNHINSHNQPDLVSEKRWREMEGYIWEIHPAFRSYLHAAQRERQLKTGMPRISRKK